LYRRNPNILRSS